MKNIVEKRWPILLMAFVIVVLFYILLFATSSNRTVDVAIIWSQLLGILL